ncbi:diguanylate cyclase (GGDEF)-like protein [Motilibacter rhizosphaerae]|uniref:Diguanylate cyclase (GGDEF)-like protein n=1 Tax=Motilibacter rhizosphaerae TaxID=598652 RepID=A0A4Q7NQP2_9ACTN|nr:sensor domain-containing diguanylate cyclase [Motilibacter rhizosphaerae]RZS87462.1 diguanylate cyclase (GGDEF)-like protein [Motilibacter rhizosphaerae]
MGLRSRLWVAVTALLLLPVLVTGLVAASVLARQEDDRAGERAGLQAQAVAQALVAECGRMQAVARELSALLGTATAAEVSAALAEVQGDGADYAGVTFADGHSASVPAGAEDRAAHAVACQDRLTAPDLVGLAEQLPGARRDASSGSGPERARTAVQAVVMETVTPTWLLTALGGVGGAKGGGALLAVDGQPVVTTLGDSAAYLRPAVLEGDEQAHGRVVRAEALGPRSPVTVVVATPAPGHARLYALTLLGTVLGCLLVVALGRAVSRALTRPLASLTEASERVVAGDLDAAVTVQSDDEVGRLGRSLNLITAEMRQYLDALQRSRDELRDNLERLGEALSSTHDLEGLVTVVLESAVAAVEARAGLAWVGETGQPFPLVAAQDIEELGAGIARRVVPGVGVLGSVAEQGVVVRGLLGDGPGQLVPGPGDPAGQHVLAVPLRGSTGVTGVLALVGRQDGRPFDARQEEEIRTLASQAGIAVDNVLLHRETERLAITDPLTGLWNFRYLSMSLAREIERASRFERTLAVLMLDIDHFKAINDTYGHARGDAVLREFAMRVGQQVREVDVLARYGGEEFVLTLPETSLEGAAQLAERIRVAVEVPHFGAGAAELPVPVTVSIGVAAYPLHGSTPAALLRAADTALYDAKRGGRNRWGVAAVTSGTGA